MKLWFRCILRFILVNCSVHVCVLIVVKGPLDSSWYIFDFQFILLSKSLRLHRVSLFRSIVSRLCLQCFWRSIVLLVVLVSFLPQRLEHWSWPHCRAQWGWSNLRFVHFFTLRLSSSKSKLAFKNVDIADAFNYPSIFGIVNPHRMTNINLSNLIESQ